MEFNKTIIKEHSSDYTKLQLRPSPSTVHSFIHSFDHSLWRIHDVSGTVLGSEEIVINKLDKHI